MKSTRTELSRRDFLKTTAVAGAGLTLSFTIPGAGAREASAAAAFEPNATLTITPDGIITVHITKAEMGQGVGTALAQIVAEELEADWKDVRIDYPMNDPKYGLMLTGGSWSVNWTFDSLSRAGAGARMLLTEAAAKQMNVAVADCVAEDGRIRHLPTGRSMPSWCSRRRIRTSSSSSAAQRRASTCCSRSRSRPRPRAPRSSCRR